MKGDPFTSTEILSNMMISSEKNVKNWKFKGDVKKLRPHPLNILSLFVFCLVKFEASCGCDMVLILLYARLCWLIEICFIPFFVTGINSIVLVDFI